MKLDIKRFLLGIFVGLVIALAIINIPIPRNVNAQVAVNFPNCQDLVKQPGDIAHYPSGQHAIVNEGIQEGQDDVYSMSDGNAVQCFCPPSNMGIQTNWWKTTTSQSSWTQENGADWGLNNASYLAQNSSFSCENTTPTPIPTELPAPTSTPVPQNINTDNGSIPTFTGSSTNPPICSDGNTIKLPANPFVKREGVKATVNFFLTEGNQANVYYKIVSQPSWQYSVIGLKPNSDNFISITINGLNANLGYDFAIQQVQGCGGGQLANAVIVDGPNARTFRLSYWEWAK